jgi:hypothetical protein
VLAGEKQAQTRGAQSQQANQAKTFSKGRGHYKIICKQFDPASRRAIAPFELTMGGDHDYRHAIGDPEEQVLRLYKESDGRQVSIRHGLTMV